MWRRSVADAALLLCVLPSCSGAAPQQSRHEWRAVLIDTASKKPVPSARIVLAHKAAGRLECTIDTALTAFRA